MSEHRPAKAMQYDKDDAGTAPEAQKSVARSNLSSFQRADATSVDLWSDSYKQRYGCGESNCRRSKIEEQIGRLCSGASHAIAMTWRWKVLFTLLAEAKSQLFTSLTLVLQAWFSRPACCFHLDYPSEPNTTSPFVTFISYVICIYVANYNVLIDLA